MASSTAARKLRRRQHLDDSNLPAQAPASVLALPSSDIEHVLMLQRTIGNHATNQLIQRAGGWKQRRADKKQARRNERNTQMDETRKHINKNDIDNKDWQKDKTEWSEYADRIGAGTEGVGSFKDELSLALSNFASENRTTSYNRIYSDWLKENHLPAGTSEDTLSSDQAADLEKKEISEGGLSAISKDSDTRDQLQSGADAAGTVALGLGGFASFVSMVVTISQFSRKNSNVENFLLALETGGEGAKTLALATQTGASMGKTIAGGIATHGNDTAQAATDMMSGITDAFGGLVPAIDLFLSGVKLVGNVMKFSKSVRTKDAKSEDKLSKRQYKDLALDSTNEALNAGKAFLSMARSTISAVQTFLDIASVASNLVSVVPFLGPAINICTQFIDIIMQLIQLVRHAIRVHKQRIRAKQMRTMIAENKPATQKINKKYLRELAKTSTDDKEQLLVKLEEVSKKRMKRAIRPMVVAAISTVADVVSVGGSLLNIIGTATAPAYGAGVGIMAAGYGLSAGSSMVKLGANASKPIAAGIRATKQGARDWVGNENAKHFKNTRKKLREKADGSRRHFVNTDKTSTKKHKRDVDTVKRLFKLLADLPEYKPAVKDDYDSAYQLLKATGVDRQLLFRKNGDPEEQMKMILKALKMRE
ncbi:MAG TPA: hypothetical protein VHD90_08300 [Phototrophicaceae bacterium]|nr:hypothetical protein [Phototrophicaceae bacterium]